jgi:hypothetical protein
LHRHQDVLRSDLPVKLFNGNQFMAQGVKIERRRRGVVAADDEVAHIDESVAFVVVVVVVAVDGADEDGSLESGSFVLGEVDVEHVDQKSTLLNFFPRH